MKIFPLTFDSLLDLSARKLIPKKYRKGWTDLVTELQEEDFEVQSVVFDSEQFKVSEAKAWAKAHGFKAKKVDTETEGEIRLRQFDPKGCAEGTFKTFSLDEGVKGVGCQRAKASPVNEKHWDGYTYKTVKKTLGKRVDVIVKVGHVDKNARTVEGWASIEELDRYGELMLAMAFKEDLETFMENPVLLWSHFGDLPAIGHFLEMKIVAGKGIHFVALFDDDEDSDKIFQKYVKGHLKAFSVGFIPLKSRTPTEREIETFGSDLKLVYVRVALVETSAVNVPAVPHALVGRSSPGMRGGLIRLEDLGMLLSNVTPAQEKTIHRLSQMLSRSSKTRAADKAAAKAAAKGKKKRAKKIVAEVKQLEGEELESAQEIAASLRASVENLMEMVNGDEPDMEAIQEGVNGLDTWSSDLVSALGSADSEEAESDEEEERQEDEDEDEKQEDEDEDDKQEDEDEDEKQEDEDEDEKQEDEDEDEEEESKQEDEDEEDPEAEVEDEDEEKEIEHGAKRVSKVLARILASAKNN